MPAWRIAAHRSILAVLTAFVLIEKLVRRVSGSSASAVYCCAVLESFF
jgi:hypothetical protein